ncbi:hypothetical protein ABPG74_021350 [Tetrahymena malaccensis]
MTEKTLLVDNPFSLETNPKRLVQKLEVQEQKERVADMEISERLYSKTKISKKFGIIRALDEEAEKMAKAREETLARDQKREDEKRKAKSVLIWDSSDNDIRKQINRINNILKEKRETIAEFIKKKREICLSNMNIYNKKEETERLEDFIKNEKESLKARKFYFENDWTMVNQFIKEVESDANDAQKEAERQQKEKEKNKEKWNQLQGEVERIEQKISRKEEEYKTLLTYKSFVDSIKEKYQEIYGSDNNYLGDKNKQKQGNNKDGNDFLYLTQPNQAGGGAAAAAAENSQQDNASNNTKSVYVIPFTPAQLKDILNHIQEKNLYHCQNNNESEEEYENKKKKKNRLEVKLEQKKNENRERIKELEKQREIAQRRRQNLISLKKFNVSKVQISEGEDLDMQKIGEKIYQIVKCIEEAENKVSKGASDTIQNIDLSSILSNQNIDTKEMRNQMHIIEKKLESITKYRENYINESEENAKRVLEIEKGIKQNRSRQIQQQQQKQNVESLNQKLKERENNLNNRRKGRTIMERTIIQKNVVQKQENLIDDQDDDEKYFNEDYTFGNDFVKQEKKLNQKTNMVNQQQVDKKNSIS